MSSMPIMVGKESVWKALDQALRQWSMYYENANDGELINEADDAESDMYRWCKKFLVAPGEGKEGGGPPQGPGANAPTDPIIKRSHYLITMAIFSDDGADGDEGLKWIRAAEARFPYLVRQEIPEDCDLEEPRAASETPPTEIGSAPIDGEWRVEKARTMVHLHAPSGQVFSTSAKHGGEEIARSMAAKLSAQPLGSGDQASLSALRDAEAFDAFWKPWAPVWAHLVGPEVTARAGWVAALASLGKPPTPVEEKDLEPSAKTLREPSALEDEK